VPLRLLEVTIPIEELERIAVLFQDIPVVQVGTSESANATGFVRILADAQDTEALSDLLVSHFGSRDNFRLILLPVEATLPPVEKPSSKNLVASIMSLLS